MKLIFTLLLITTCASCANKIEAQSTISNIERYEKIAAEFQCEADLKARAEYYSKQGVFENSIVFAGSSTIDGWKNLSATYAKYNSINRGIGGFDMRHMIACGQKLAFMHNPKVVVIYIGDNDISRFGVSMFKELLACYIDYFFYREPKSKIIFISIKPSPSRSELWPQFREANECLNHYSKINPSIYFINVWDEIATGPSLYFEKDQLHLSVEGYKIIDAKLLKLLEKISK